MPGEGEQARTWHNLQSEDGDVTMGDGDDDADDELVPGCYELDVDPSPVSDVDTIWIRAEYIRAYNYTESRYDRCYKRRRAAVVFTGHPGTGEWGSTVVCYSGQPLNMIKARPCPYCIYYVGVFLPTGQSSLNRKRRSRN